MATDPKKPPAPKSIAASLISTLGTVALVWIALVWIALVCKVPNLFDRHGSYMFDLHNTNPWSYAARMARTSKYQKHLAATLAMRPSIREERLDLFDTHLARAAAAYVRGDQRLAGRELREAQLLNEEFAAATTAKLQSFYAARVAKKLAAEGGLKVCNKCKQRLELTHFHRQGVGLTGTIYHRGICKECAYTQQKSWRSTNPDKFKKQRDFYNARRSPHTIWKYRFKLTEVQAAAVFAVCGDSCQICKQPETRKGRRLSLDHCHKTGRLRGFVCSRCNLLIGRANDDPEMLERAAYYLRNADLSYLLTAEAGSPEATDV